MCKDPDCDKTANYGIPGEKAQFCRKHMLPGMINVRSKRCAQPDCTKHPGYGTPGGKPEYCKEHALPGMQLTNKKCKAKGCPKQPCFALPGEKAVCCKEHAEKGMVDVRNTQCKAPGCPIKPNFGFPDGKAEYCKKHALKGMEDILSTRCADPECIIRASYGPSGGTAKFCRKHASTDMCDVNNTLCHCGLRASYGFEDGAPEFCSQHAQFGMKNILTKKCAYEDCDVVPVFGLTGNAQEELFCKKHATPLMVDVRNCLPCCGCNLNWDKKSLLGGLCRYCHPESDNRSKEEVVKQILLQNFPNLTWIHNRTNADIINMACKKYRPDFWVDCGSHIVIVECDEFSHMNYEISCELARLVELVATCNGRPLVVIRYNPDKHCSIDKCTLDRHAELVRRVQASICTPPEQLLDISYLFYHRGRQSDLEAHLSPIMNLYQSAGE